MKKLNTTFFKATIAMLLLFNGTAQAQVVISQIYGGGGNGSAVYKNDYIELFNTSDVAVSLAGWSVQYAATTGTSWTPTLLTGNIAPNSYFLVQEASGGANGSNLPTADKIGTINLSATAGKVVLSNSTATLTGSCPTGTSIKDEVGFGTGTNCFEGTGPTASISSTLAVFRANSSCTNTNNNANDFVTGMPAPRNSVSTPHSCIITSHWAGTSSNDWNTAGNWDLPGVPAASGIVIIPSGTPNSPNLNGGSFSAASLQLLSGAILATGTGTLNLTGTLDNSGTITATTGGITLNGSTQQNITGTGTIGNLTLNNAAGSTVSAGVQTLKGTLVITNGTFDIGAGNFIVYSDATTTGRIGTLGAGAALTGDLTVQRFVPAKAARAFSFLASPVTNFINFNWQNQIHVTGASDGTGTICTTGNGTADADVKQDNGFDPTVSHTPSFYYYDGSDIGNEWKSITATTNNTTTSGLMVPGTGYRVNVRGDRTVDGCNLLDDVTTAPGAVTLISKGFAATGNIAATVPVATFDGVTDDNNYTYALVGNPYACEIDFDNATWSSLRTTNKLTNAYYVYSPCNAAGTYTSYIDGVSANNTCTGLTAANVIASGQSFFVERHSVSGDVATTLTINNFFQEGFKTNAHQLGAFKTTNVNDKIRVALNDAAGAHIDEFFTRFTSNGTNNYNSNTDASSFGENANYIATAKDDGRYLAISTMPAISGEDTVPVIVYTAATGAYQLGFSEHQGISGDVLLVDSYLGTVQDVKATPSYNFNVTADAASFGENRFYVVFNFMATSVGNLKAVTTLHVYPNPVSNELNVAIANGNYMVRITNAVGAEMYSSNTTVSNSTMHIDTKALPAGIYIIEATGSNGKAVAKFVK